MYSRVDLPYRLRELSTLPDSHGRIVVKEELHPVINCLLLAAISV